MLEDSTERQNVLAKRLLSQSAKSLAALGSSLDVAPVLNDDSYQQMVFCPVTGKFKVWRYLTR